MDVVLMVMIQGPQRTLFAIKFISTMISQKLWLLLIMSEQGEGERWYEKSGWAFAIISASIGARI
jgi:hypothetical protein